MVRTHSLTHLLTYFLTHSLTHSLTLVDVELTKKMNEEIKDASKFDTYRISNNRSYMKQEAGRNGLNETKETNPMHGI